MTLATMLAELYGRLNLPATPDGAVEARMRRHINAVIREVLSTPGLGRLTAFHDPITFASVANIPRYALPQTLEQITTLREVDNDRRLRLATIDWYQALDPDPTSNTGTPECWVPLGWTAASTQPSNASEIFVKSSSASDTSQKVYLEGIRTTSWYPVSLSASLNGTTAVTFGATYTDITQITKVYLSQPCVGTVTIHEDSGAGTTLATIPIAETYSRYPLISLWPTPSSAITYYVDGIRRLTDLVQEMDEPPLPRLYHHIIVDGAYSRELEKRDDDRYRLALARFQDGLSKLKMFVWYPPDAKPHLGVTDRPHRSRLGAWYPAQE